MREDQLQQEPEPESKANEGNQGGASSLAKQPAILRPDEIDHARILLKNRHINRRMKTLFD
jgi:hypothetical protein